MVNVKESWNRERLQLPRIASHDKETSATPIETQTRKNLILKITQGAWSIFKMGDDDPARMAEYTTVLKRTWNTWNYRPATNRIYYRQVECDRWTTKLSCKEPAIMTYPAHEQNRHNKVQYDVIKATNRPASECSLARTKAWEATKYYCKIAGLNFKNIRWTCRCQI